MPVAFHPGVHVDTPGACRKFGLVAVSENQTITNMAMDELHGRIWRIGTMGHVARKANVLRCLASLEAVLRRNGQARAGTWPGRGAFPVRRLFRAGPRR